MAMIEADALAAATQRCLMLSMDTSLSLAQRTDLNANGKRLRAAWVNLVSAEFSSPEAMAKLAQLSALTKAINQDLGQKIDSAKSFAVAMQNVNKAVGVLDSLLGLAAKFA